MKAFKRSSTVLSVVILVAACGAFVLFNWSAFGWKALSVPTGSMRPVMPPGSLALVHRVSDSSLKVGDVITYTNPRDPKMTISHRIVKTYMIGGKIPGYVTKGDANKHEDVPVPAGLVEGRVVWHVQHVGAWLMWSKTWAGIAVLVYVPALLITIEEMVRLNDYYKRWQPYRLLGYHGYELIKREASRWTPRLAGGLAMFVVVIFAAGAFGPRAAALIGSNTVTLANNRISSGVITNGGGTGGATCMGNNDNNINVNNTTTQTAKSGNVKNSNNTNGGSATSGNASNNNNTSVTITITNC